MIEQLRAPCLQAADTVFHEILRIIAELDTKEINRFWKYALHSSEHQPFPSPDFHHNP